MRPCAINMASSGPFPYLTMFSPGSFLSSATNAATSPSMTVAFQFVFEGG